MKKHLLFSLFIFNFSLSPAWARQVSATNNGFWETPGSWSVGSVPVCGDTITIPEGITVTINSHQNYESCSMSMLVSVKGTLQLTNGNKLSLPCNSCLQISSLGQLRKASSGGGNSTFVKICNAHQWKADDGPIVGPFSTCGTLPVTLLYFDARVFEGKTEISWVTASEINNDYFIVEQSTDGEQFSEITRVRGAGSTNETTEYGCTDYFPPSGISYYRLKQVDYDGTSSYSDVIAVHVRIKSSFSILSAESTVNQTVRIVFASKSNALYQLQVFELNGAQVYSMELAAHSGMNNREFFFPFLRKGIYLLTLSSDDQGMAKKMLLFD